jgi:HK97 family phage major capsid protein
VTNELLDDAPALEGYINKVAPSEIAFKTTDAVVSGSGAGMPLGILNSPARITVAAVGGQGAATLVPENFAAMWARMYAPCRRNAVWLINQDIEPQLDGLKYATGSSSGQLVYQPPAGISQTPYSTIKGRPVIVLEQCATLGTEGDVILADLSEIAAAAKVGGVKSEMSIHLRFDYDESVFKFSYRFDSQCFWDQALTPFKGSLTQGPLITLSSTRT